MVEVTGVAAAIAVESAPLRIVDRLFDHENPATLGPEAIPGDHTVVYRATEANFTFSHQQNIGVFAGKLYLMWSNGITHEDHNGQRILYAYYDQHERPDAFRIVGRGSRLVVLGRNLLGAQRGPGG